MKKNPQSEETERSNGSKTSSSFPSSSSLYPSASQVVGLRIVTQVSQTKSNIVVKTTVRASLHNKLIGSRNQNQNQNQNSSMDLCFLKACSLCSKKLSLDQDIYMYRGDEGFCSVECRDRRISIDEMKELETSTRSMLSSPRHCYPNSLRNETRMLREELRRRWQDRVAPKTRAVFS